MITRCELRILPNISLLFWPLGYHEPLSSPPQAHSGKRYLHPESSVEHLAYRLLGERDPEWLAAHVPCASSASWECSSLWKVAETSTFWWHVYICQHFSITPNKLLINEQKISRNHLANHKIIFLLNNICISLHWGVSVLKTLPYQKIW